MKTNAIVRIVLFSLAILILGGILLVVLCFGLLRADGNTHIEKYTETSDVVEQADINYYSTQVRNIDIEWVSGTITILKNAAVSEITVTEYAPINTEHQMQCKQSGQTLKIKFSEESMKFPSFGIDVDVSKDLIITVPADWSCNSLDIDAAAAAVEIIDLSINELDFDGASGTLVLDSCDIDILDIDTASGNVEFSGTLKELDFDAASARFDGEFFNIPQKLDLDAMSGDMTLVLPEHSGFYLEHETVSGSFDSDFDFHTMGAHYECGDSACKIKISALSGDVNILKGVANPQFAAGNTAGNESCTDINCTDSAHNHSKSNPVENCNH